MNIRKTVLQEGINIFQRFGIQNLTMEEIIAELKISKGTLFEIAHSKEELLEQCIDEALTTRKMQFNSIMEQAANPLYALQQLLKSHLNSVIGLHPDFLPDLKNHHQLCWEKVSEFSSKYLEPYVTKLLELSVEAGLLQSDLNSVLISRFLLVQSNTVFEAGLFHTFNCDSDTIFNISFGCYLKGLATNKGAALLQNPLATSIPSLN